MDEEWRGALSQKPMLRGRTEEVGVGSNKLSYEDMYDAFRSFPILVCSRCLAGRCLQALEVPRSWRSLLAYVHGDWSLAALV